MAILRWYRYPGLAENHLTRKLNLLKQASPLVGCLQAELCFNVELEADSQLTKEELERLRWILSSVFEPHNLTEHPRLVPRKQSTSLLVEIGPRLNFSTAFSSNAVSICHSIGLLQVTRLEVSTRYLIGWHQEGLTISPLTEEKLITALHDRMTECRYWKPVESFVPTWKAEPWFHVDVMKNGRKALEDVNSHLGLSFDKWDLDFYTELFREKLKRNPTSVECFDLAQSNSEHSRHWFFKGEMVIDGKKKIASLLDMIIKTQSTSNDNNVVKFSDNSSAIRGFSVSQFSPSNPTEASAMTVAETLTHLIFTAETHNFPTGVAPFSGATTGTGGRLRDVQGVGRGGSYIAGTAGYCVGNLLMSGYTLPWEDASQVYPSNFAPPLEILIQASNGASDYGNKFGEPLISGFVRSFGLVDLSGERREWIKPVMFSAGLGTMQDAFIDKMKPEKGMRVVKLGGPVYRIGVGGGAASSVEVQGDSSEERDFNAVQRGDAQMEQKLNRVIRACVEMGDANPICSIHDQGAGGNGNVLKELVEPSGGVIFTHAVELGDITINTLELWGAEYQESDAILCRPQDKAVIEKIAERERCPVCFVGTVLDCGKVVLSEEPEMDDSKYLDGSWNQEESQYPVNLDLELVLGKMPRKVFALESKPVIVKQLTLPAKLTVMDALGRVLRLPSVASKRYLTNKVDRCVTGLIAQQQCVGPLHTPLADVAVTAISLFNTVGIATAIGEQPIKGLIDAGAGARMTVGEVLSNLVFAKISCIEDVKCSGNWMWAAKLPGEGAALYTACSAMCQVMGQLGIAIDGGKDSLSMAARVGTETVKAPGMLVVSAYAPCPDIRQVVTPDLKCASLGRRGALLLVDLSMGRARLGGSALAQCYKQLGDDSPDMNDPIQFKRAFQTTQQLIQDGIVMSGHDISDGGLVTCVLEMAFSGLAGINIDLTSSHDVLETLFSEELGWVLEVSEEKLALVQQMFQENDVACRHIGHSADHGIHSQVLVSVNGHSVLDSDVLTLFRLWEETSYQLDLLQANPDCVTQEFRSLARRKAPQYRLTFDPATTFSAANSDLRKVRVAVLREEGTNGDREMAAALFKAGFEVWDVTMQDLLAKKVTVDHFRGIVFPGGFSYADVLGSAKGWAASLLFHPSLRAQLQAFYQRSDTFSLGVCNGCQLMSLLGWVGCEGQGETADVVLDHNLSGRFECRWSTVKILKSNSVMLRGMEGCVLGIWVAHGEGRFTFRDESVLPRMEATNCCALKYVDDDRNPTEEYPFNPNGSTGGLAGVCSVDGRHLAMMPHPERCTQTWQWPWMPLDWRSRDLDSPWQRMFHNAYNWCLSTD